MGHVWSKNFNRHEMSRAGTAFSEFVLNHRSCKDNLSIFLKHWDMLFNPSETSLVPVNATAGISQQLKKNLKENSNKTDCCACSLLVEPWTRKHAPRVARTNYWRHPSTVHNNTKSAVLYIQNASPLYSGQTNIQLRTSKSYSITAVSLSAKLIHDSQKYHESIRSLQFIDTDYAPAIMNVLVAKRNRSQT